MESKVKLSPAMQAMMWKTLALETDAWRNRYAWQHADGRLVLGVRVTASTYVALASRGLIEHDRTELADAGRAWITEQIEAAREDALLDNMSWHDARDDGIGWVRAARLAMMWGTLPVQPQEILNDKIEAWALYTAAHEAIKARDTGAGTRAVYIARREGYSLDVLRKIAA